MFMMRDDVSGQLFEHLLCTVLRSDFAESFHDNAVLTSEGKSLGIESVFSGCYSF
jgi:hypothetical protein